MNNAAIVSGLKAFSHLRYDRNQSLRVDAPPGSLKQLSQVGSPEKRHDKVRFCPVPASKFSDVVNVDDIGVTKVGKDVPLFAELFYGRAVNGPRYGLNCYFAVAHTDIYG